MVGGLLGGFVVARHGLKFWLWPMLLAIHLPDAVFIWLAYAQPENLFAIGAGVAVEQFGYGFGFTAFMLYMIYIARGEHRDGALRHLHRLHGAGHDAAGHVERLVAGTHRLSAFLRLGDSGDDSQFHRRGAHPARGGVRETEREVRPEPKMVKARRKRIALNAPSFPESKFAMKQSCFHRFCRASGSPRRGLWIFAGGARAIRFHSPTPHPPAPRRPSIILIQCDGLGYGDLSCYGQTKFQTPNLDRLAAEGIRFTSYYAGDAASSPARAALMLGRDSGHLKQRADVDVPLAADDITVAQVLAAIRLSHRPDRRMGSGR